MKIRNIIYTGLGLSLIHLGSAHAGEAGWSKFSAAPAPVQGPSYIFSIGAGAMWASEDQNQVIALFPEIDKAYVGGDDGDAVFNGELFGGVVREFSGMQAALGVAVAINSSIGFGGDVWEDADPDFNNYFYHYRVRSTRVSLKGKLSKEMSMGIAPFVSASIGAAVNNARSYGEVAKIPEEVVPPPFRNRSTTQLTYALGIGLQKAIDEHVAVGIGYEYADLGSATLGRAFGQPQNAGPHLSNITTHSAMLYVSYVG